MQYRDWSQPQSLYSTMLYRLGDWELQTMRLLASKVAELYNRWKERQERNRELADREAKRERSAPKPHAIRVRWNNDSKPFRGPCMGPMEGWQKGSRQVRRAALRTIAFAQVSIEEETKHYSRRTRRLAARANVKLMFAVAKAQRAAANRPTIRPLAEGATA